MKAPDEARAVALLEGEQVASIGENRKMVIFPLEQLPEMARGAGVRLQRYKDGGLSDVKTFKGADGLTWTDGAGRAFSLTLKELVRLARQPRRCRPARAEGLPAQQQVPLKPRRRRPPRYIGQLNGFLGRTMSTLSGTHW